MTEPQAVTQVGGDPILRILARLANDVPSAEIHVTLAVGGALVSGVLVSRLAWLRLSAETMEAVAPRAGTIPAELSKTLEAQAARPSEEHGGTDAGGVTYEYLHLKDARYVAATGTMPSLGAPPLLWRGRIAQVSGWSWGSFQAS